MHTKFDADQIRLLELFSSIEYFADMRDKWRNMIEHVEDCLSSYMSNLPPRYRSKPLPEQPDIVWGHRVLPNFRRTLEGLNEGLILLANGDTSGLGYAHGITNDFKGQLDYWPIGWMRPEDEKIYADNVYSASQMAHYLCFTGSADWAELETSYYIQELQLIQKHSALRSYKINKNIYVDTGKKITVQGIYVPSLAEGCPQFLGTHLKSAPPTRICVRTEELFNPETGEKYDEQKFFEKFKCTWYLVEAAEDSSTTKAGFDEYGQKIRVSSGELCPQTGFYFTPAHLNSRRSFNAGDVMPSLDTSYGKTIWQWDDNQA